MREMRDRLIELLMDSEAFNDADGKADAKHIANHLLANGVIVLPAEMKTRYSKML